MSSVQKMSRKMLESSAVAGMSSPRQVRQRCGQTRATCATYPRTRAEVDLRAKPLRSGASRVRGRFHRLRIAEAPPPPDSFAPLRCARDPTPPPPPGGGGQTAPPGHRKPKGDTNNTWPPFREARPLSDKSRGRWKARQGLVALPRIGREFLLLVGLTFPFLGVFRRLALDRDVGPLLGVLGIERQPFLQARFGVRLDGVDRTFGLAHAAIDALVRMDDEHVLAFVEAVDRTHFHAVHVLAADAIVVDDVGHLNNFLRGLISAACLTAGPPDL